MCNVRTSICMAQEVGARLGIGEILQRSVPKIGLKFGIMVIIHRFIESEKT